MHYEFSNDAFFSGRKLRYFINKGLWREPLRRADGKAYPPDVQRREVKLDIVNDFHKVRNKS